MTRRCTTVIKILLYIFNGLSLLFALGCVILGSMLVYYTEKCRTEAETDLLLRWRDCWTMKHPYGLPVAILVFGLIVFFVCFMGCLGACQESVCQLIAYGILCFIFAIIMAVLVGITDHEKAESIFDSHKKQISDYHSEEFTDTLMEAFKHTVWLLSVYAFSLVCAGIFGIIFGCKLRDARSG